MPKRVFAGEARLPRIPRRNSEVSETLKCRGSLNIQSAPGEDDLYCFDVSLKVTMRGIRCIAPSKADLRRDNTRKASQRGLQTPNATSRKDSNPGRPCHSIALENDPRRPRQQPRVRSESL